MIWSRKLLSKTKVGGGGREMFQLVNTLKEEESVQSDQKELIVMGVEVLFPPWLGQG